MFHSFLIVLSIYLFKSFFFSVELTVIGGRGVSCVCPGGGIGLLVVISKLYLQGLKWWQIILLG